MGSDEPLINAEAELIALQKNFDDYIAESRELEEELEQEVLKLQKKLEVSTASNTALISRLESVTPQLLGLEQEIQQLRLKLEDEVIRRRQAEQEQDKAESARRAAESTVQRLQEENDALHEELAFQSSELEEARNAFSEATLRQEEEFNIVQKQLEELREASLTHSSSSATPVSEPLHEKITLNGFSHNKVDEQAAYIKSLEDELELVTEQLIDTQKKLTQTELQWNENEQSHRQLTLELNQTTAKLDEALEEVACRTEALDHLEAEISKLQGDKDMLNNEIEALQHELKLSNEEIELVQELLNKVEEDKNLNITHSTKEIQLLQTMAADNSHTDFQSLLNAAQARMDGYEALLKEKECMIKSLEASLEALNLQVVTMERDLEKEQQLHNESQEKNRKLTALVDQLGTQLSTIDTSRSRGGVESYPVKFTEGNDSEKPLLSVNVENLHNELSQTKEKLESTEGDLRRGEAELQTLRSQFSVLEDALANQKHAYHESLTERDRLLSLLQQGSSLNVVTTQIEAESAVLPSPLFSPAARSILHHQDDSFEIDLPSSVNSAVKSIDVNKMAAELRKLATKSHQMREHNALLLNQILSLQGNIQVCCRIRPLSATENRKNIEIAVEPLSETEVGCLDSKTNTWKSYVFDKVWGPDQDQQDVFLDVEPLSLSVVDGYNCCIFAYGQTGSGKTHTMQGSSANDGGGISQRTILKIFNLLQQRERQARASTQLRHDEEGNTTESIYDFSITVGMLEIYNEGVYDLLSSMNADEGNRSNYQRESLEIRKDASGNTCVENLTKSKVHSLNDVMRLLQIGNLARATASTNLNERSSRSHMILQVEVCSGVSGQPGNAGKLFLVDLAGSERVRNSGVSGKELKEAQYINKSLSALSDVMEALDRKAPHIPYRNSKLTHLLQDSLGGNSRTMMVVTVSPGSESYQETQYALQFSSKVRNINLGKAQRNVASKNLEEKIKSLTQEMKSLQKSKEKSEELLQSLRRDHQRVQEQLASAKQTRSTSQQETLTLAALRKSNDEMTTRWQKQKDLCDKLSNQLESLQNELRKSQQQSLQLTKERDTLNNMLVQRDVELNDTKKDLRISKDALVAANLRNRRSQLMGASAASLLERNISEVSKSSYVANLTENFNKFASHTSSPSSTGPTSVIVGYPVSKLSSNISTRAKFGTRFDRNNSQSTALSTGLKDSNKPLRQLYSMSSQPLSPLTSIGDADGPSTKAATQSEVSVTEVREKILNILQKHDPVKARRLDKILENFKGRESLLLEKVIAKYEGDSFSQNGETNSVASSCITSPIRRSELALERHKERIRKSLDLRKNLKSR